MKVFDLFTRDGDVFRKDSPYRKLLLSILITGLSYGLYKGMLDNYLVEIVGMGEMDRGVTEFFRELPGILLVLILAVFYMLSAESLFKVGALIMLVGMGMNAVLPASKVLTTIAICVYSLGEHIQLGMKNTLSLSYAKTDCGGRALGTQNATSQIGTLVGYLVIVGAFSAVAGESPYHLFFCIAAALAGISCVFALRITGSSQTDKHKRRLFRKRYYG